MKKNLIVTLMGPTGVGKTDLIIELYSQIPITIISVDSIQIYKDLNIGSGKPSNEVLKKYPHELIDFVEPTESYSTARFQEDVIHCIKDSFEANKTPVLVGGTMMYFHHLINGISKLPSVSNQIRIEVQSEFDEKGSEEMHKYLQKIDRKSSLKIHPNDSQRIKRAIEVYKATGKEFSNWQTEQKKEINEIIGESNTLQIAIKPLDRQLHRADVAKRFLNMIDKGLVEEVERILNLKGMSINSQSMKSVGYRQVCQFLDGDYGLDDMIIKAINSTRQLAKRQMTWINGWDDLTLLEKDPALPSYIKNLILKNL